MTPKETLSEIFGFYKYKIDNDLCTPEEIENAAKLVQQEVGIYASIEDLAKFYGKSKDAVSGVIKRRMFEKPRRNIVLYSFRAFQKYVPDSWRRTIVAKKDKNQ